jgi:hypothetical protein
MPVRSEMPADRTRPAGTNDNGRPHDRCPRCNNNYAGISYAPAQRTAMPTDPASLARLGRRSRRQYATHCKNHRK